MKYFLNCSLVRAWASGTATLFDIFGQRAPLVTFGTPADDAKRLHDDLRSVGKDFHSVLSRKELFGAKE